MGLLVVKDKAAFFCMPDEQEKDVMEVTPNDVEKALELLVDDEKLEICGEEDINAASTIANPAQKIVFEQLWSGFKGVQDSSPAFREEVDKVFADAEAKYLNDSEESQE